MNDTANQTDIDINDPFLQDYSGGDYDKFLADADKDNRLGDQDFLITEKVPGKWDDGTPYIKLNGVLSSANNAKFNMMFTAPPKPAELATIDAGRKRGVALTIRLLKELQEFYATSPTLIEEGTTIRVKVDKDKVDKETGKYYLRGVAIKPKSEVGRPAGVGAAASASTAAAAEF